MIKFGDTRLTVTNLVGVPLSAYRQMSLSPYRHTLTVVLHPGLHLPSCIMLIASAHCFIVPCVLILSPGSSFSTVRHLPSDYRSFMDYSLSSRLLHSRLLLSDPACSTMYLSRNVNKGSQMDPLASRLFLPVTEQSVNKDPAAQDTAVQIMLLKQGERSVEEYVLDFITLARQTAMNDLCLMVFFRGGLSEPFGSSMPLHQPHWTLRQYLDIALHISGSSLTVDVAEKQRDIAAAPAAQPARVMAAAPVHAHKMAAAPERVHTTAATTEPVHKVATTAEPVHKMAAASERVHTMAATAEPVHKMAARTELRHVTAAIPEPYSVAAAFPESSQVFKSSQVAAELPESSQVSKSSQITAAVPMSSQAGAVFPASSQVRAALPKASQVKAVFLVSGQATTVAPVSSQITAVSSVSSQVTALIPGPSTVKMAATPEPLHKMAATPEPVAKMAVTPESVAEMAAKPAPANTMSVKPPR
ncbi:Retrotransposon Gag-like protein 9 [Labeo rohita]|uniref:Retrotransposon Gag-like protein 9 n=1 Tax=Labeo rohita TaxID=84645 RepID=A0ABQ8MF12_LABRO|nr:Retrotransposon Gag-like protein 9 [Labeo rohita]